MSTPIPMTVFEPTLPIENIDQFFREIQDLVDNITGPWRSLLFEESDRGLLANAWTELKPRLAVIPQQILQISKGLLEQLGLDGAQLELKLSRLNQVWTNFKEKGKPKRLKKLLELIIDLLGSLKSAIPIA